MEWMGIVLPGGFGISLFTLRPGIATAILRLQLPVRGNTHFFGARRARRLKPPAKREAFFILP